MAGLGSELEVRMSKAKGLWIVILVLIMSTASACISQSPSSESYLSANHQLIGKKPAVSPKNTPSRSPSPSENVQSDESAQPSDVPEITASPSLPQEEVPVTTDTPIVNSGNSSVEEKIEPTYVFDSIIIVNKKHRLDKSYVPENLVRYGKTGYYLTQETVDALKTMLDAAKEDGISIVLTSAYRTYARQETLFKQEVNKYKKYGDDAERRAGQVVAPPGASEHQLGTTVDLRDPKSTKFSEFKYTEQSEWIKENCAKYGFIIRYPEGKTDITDIIYEPWHLRYLGVEYAKKITESGLCLEEWLDADS